MRRAEFSAAHSASAAAARRSASCDSASISARSFSATSGFVARTITGPGDADCASGRIIHATIATRHAVATALPPTARTRRCRRFARTLTRSASVASTAGTSPRPSASRRSCSSLSCVIMVFQYVLQHRPGTVEANLDRAARLAEHLADLVYLHLLQVAEHDNLAIPIRQLGHGPSHASIRFVTLVGRRLGLVRDRR